jgi:hypothetical protein
LTVRNERIVFPQRLRVLWFPVLIATARLVGPSMRFFMLE